MNTKQIFDLGINLGIKADPRGKAGIKRWLNLEKKKFDSLTKDEKKLFDTERLTNPYSDSRILFNNSNAKIKKVLAGIDIGVAEIALIVALSNCRPEQSEGSHQNQDSSPTLRMTEKPDLIIAHHPEGKALAALDEVMHLQADLMASYGVPINVAEGVMRERICKVSRQISPENHNQSVDAARLAQIPILNLHTPCDNLVFSFLQNLFDKKKPETLADIIELLNTIPEYRQASLDKAGPRIFAGNPENRAGKIVAFDITGGTSGAKEIYPELVKAGIGTVIGMHMNEENREEALKNHLNVVIAGHISSDSLGLNLFLDELEKLGIEIVPLSGLIRIKRFK